MRNYIELNGKSSAEINGLLIQELPPISKPKMRNRVEEIDGRAGDIITQLGFKAYDKTIKMYPRLINSRGFSLKNPYGKSDNTPVFCFYCTLQKRLCFLQRLQVLFEVF